MDTGEAIDAFTRAFDKNKTNQPLNSDLFSMDVLTALRSEHNISDTNNGYKINQISVC